MVEHVVVVLGIRGGWVKIGETAGGANRWSASTTWVWSFNMTSRLVEGLRRSISLAVLACLRKWQAARG